MGLLDSVLGQVMGQMGGSSAKMKMIQTVVGMVGGSGALGGIGGLIQKFTDGGQAKEAESWVGTGENQPVSAEQVRAALGDDEIQRVADEAGVSTDEAAGGLAALLPTIIDKVTPDGQLPDSGSLAERLQKLL